MGNKKVVRKPWNQKLKTIYIKSDYSTLDENRCIAAYYIYFVIAAIYPTLKKPTILHHYGNRY